MCSKLFCVYSHSDKYIISHQAADNIGPEHHIQPAAEQDKVY